MKRDEQSENIIRREIDAEFSFLDSRPSLHHDIMSRIRGESVVKKKISIGLVFALVLLLTGAMALAASLLWREYVPQMKQTEHEVGDYAQWPSAMRIQLAADIVSMGYLEASDDADVLSDTTATEAERAEAADRLMLKLIGQQDVKEIHSNLITYAVMGHEDTWTPEQRVWWNELTSMYTDAGAPDTLIVPANENITEKDAIAIARAAIMAAYGFDEAFMANARPVADLYVTDQRPDYKRWNIQFKKYREGSDTYLEKVYCAIVDECGEVISDPDVGIDHPAKNAAEAKKREEQQTRTEPEVVKIYKKYADLENSSSFWHWSLESKAAYSKEIRPLVQRAIDLGWIVPFDHPDAGEYDRKISCSTVYQYGLPKSGEIEETAAQKRALDELGRRYGCAAESFRYIYPSFDVTDSQRHLWRFMFYPDNGNETGVDEIPFALVELDAKTGEIITCETFDRSNMITDYDFAMKWY